MVVLMGLFKLGTIINKVPHYVIEGFTLGIAVIIALQQLPMALGVAKGEGERTLVIAFNTIKSGSFNYASIAIVAITLLFKFNFTNNIINFDKFNTKFPCNNSSYVD